MSKYSELLNDRVNRGKFYLKDEFLTTYRQIYA